MPYKDKNVKRVRARVQSREYFKEHYTDEAFREDRKSRLKKWRTDLRRKVIEHYGGKCSCCGERGFEFLTLSHPNNDGKKQRRELGLTTLYYWLLKNNFPTDYEIVVECWNCNFGRRSNDGICPHKSKGG